MKYMKKLVTLVLALALLAAMSVGVFAAETTNNGTITIDNAVVGQTYTIYQLLELESYDATSGAYAYKAVSAWETWLRTQASYLTFDAQGYVTWVTGADAAAFAKAAQAYAKEKSIGNDGTATATTAEVKFENLKLGYYLVDSTLGTLCSLDTTNPDVTIKEKNKAPETDKEVKEDSTNTYGKTNDGDIGQTVEYKATITAQVGAENYVFYDQMSKGLTYQKDAKVYINDEMTVELDTKYYTVDDTPDTDGKYTFKITFKKEYLDTITGETKLYVHYTAKINEDAVVGLPGNPNKNWLEYGDENNTDTNKTPDKETITYTWDLDVLKYANGEKSKVLKDAQFVLLSSDKSKVATIVDGKLTGWVDVPTVNEGEEITWPANTVLTTNESGKIEIDGLDADTYYLREVKAPAGYNKLANDVEVEITGATTGDDGTTLTYTTVVAEVNNQSGTELPSTGGIGTTIFYVLGGLLVAGAVVLLVTRRRMNAEN